MASTLTPASAAALARLRAYKPPPTQYFAAPLARRAAVLILLFADKRGDLRVVLTMRAAGMNTYAGHAALPGGRADALSETPFQTARREACEEIGLPLLDAKLPHPWRVEHLCQMPANLARTELAVRPCVAFLAADRDAAPASPNSSSTSPTSPSAPSPSPSPSATSSSSSSSTSSTNTSTNSGGDATTVPTTTAAAAAAEDVLIPRLSPNEVAAVFTAPFRGFLMGEQEVSANAGEAEAGVEAAGFPAKWYQGAWTDWHESRWRMHNFYVPAGKGVVRPRRKEGREAGEAGLKGEEEGEEEEERFRVFGMTARILVDAARVAYDEEPRFEHNSHFGDEDMIARLLRMGRLSGVRKKGDVLTREVLREAAKL